MYLGSMICQIVEGYFYALFCPHIVYLIPVVASLLRTRLLLNSSCLWSQIDYWRQWFTNRPAQWYFLTHFPLIWLFSFLSCFSFRRCIACREAWRPPLWWSRSLMWRSADSGDAFSVGFCFSPCCISIDHPSVVKIPDDDSVDRPTKHPSSVTLFLLCLVPSLSRKMILSSRNFFGDPSAAFGDCYFNQVIRRRWGGWADLFPGFNTHDFILAPRFAGPVVLTFAFSQSPCSDMSSFIFTYPELFRWLFIAKGNVILSHIRLRYTPRLSDMGQWYCSRVYGKWMRHQRIKTEVIAILYQGSLCMGQFSNVGASFGMVYDTLLPGWSFALDMAQLVRVMELLFSENCVSTSKVSLYRVSFKLVGENWKLWVCTSFFFRTVGRISHRCINHLMYVVRTFRLSGPFCGP